MKFLKYFEDIQEMDRRNPNYKYGDYILVNSDHNQIYDEVMTIDTETDDDIFACSFVKKEGGAEIFVDEIVRKLEDFEIDALKYNL